MTYIWELIPIHKGTINGFILVWKEELLVRDIDFNFAILQNTTVYTDKYFLSYLKNMKPYVFSKKKNEKDGTCWQ